MKTYCNVCNKYGKSTKVKIYNFKKNIQSHSVVYSKYDHEYQKIFKEEDSIEILKILGLITNIEECQKLYIIMSEENISQDFRLKIIDETRNYFIKEINQN